MNRLMVDILGYPEYASQGGDWVIYSCYSFSSNIQYLTALRLGFVYLANSGMPLPRERPSYPF